MRTDVIIFVFYYYVMPDTSDRMFAGWIFW